MSVSIQTADFDVAAEIATVHASDPQVGAVATFIGTVRDTNDGSGVAGMALEHYPGMTERAIEAVIEQARERWDILRVRVVHRVGVLAPTDRIVLVAVASSHREDAFRACHFIMDFLKTQAPIWKKERTSDGERWVQARASDDEAASRWNDEPS